MLDNPILLIGGLATLVTAVVGAIVALSKRRPEVTRVLIESAGELVVSQSTLLRDAVASAESARKRLDALEQRALDQDRILKAASVEIRDLQQDLEEMHEEVQHLTQSRDAARREAAEAREEVARLRAEVALLRETLTSHNIEIPPTPPLTRRPSNLGEKKT